MFDLAPIPVPDLSGRTILVTGAGRGIGAALVRILVDNGARVYAGIYRPESGGVEELPKSATRIELDVTSASQVEAAIDEIEKDTGRLDVLVNNAGIISPIGHLGEIGSEALSDAFAVNVAGLHRMTAAALPLLKASRGTIVNAGTGAATTPMEGWVAYCTSKAGAHMLTRMMDLELRDEGIRSFFVGIPPTDTEMQRQIRESGLNPISQIAQRDLVRPDVPASVLAYMCSPVGREIPDVLLDVRDERFRAMAGK